MLPDKRLDLTKKEAWTEANAPFIAITLGYVLNNRFLQALDVFVAHTVNEAKLTQFLPTVAQGHFKNVQPPLERLPNKQG